MMSNDFSSLSVTIKQHDDQHVNHHHDQKQSLPGSNNTNMISSLSSLSIQQPKTPFSATSKSPYFPSAFMFSDHILWTDILLHIAQYHVCTLGDVYCVWSRVSRDLYDRIHRFTFEQDRTDLSIERLFGNICKVKCRMPGEARRRSSSASTANGITPISKGNVPLPRVVPRKHSSSKLPLSNSEVNLVREHDVFHFYLKHHFFTRVSHYPNDGSRPISRYNSSYYCVMRDLDFVFKTDDVEQSFLSFFKQKQQQSQQNDIYEEILLRVHFHVYSDFTFGPLQRADFSKLYLLLEEEDGRRTEHSLPFYASKFAIFDLTTMIRGTLTYQLNVDLIPYLDKPNSIQVVFEYGQEGYSRVTLFRNDPETMRKLSLNLMYKI